MDSTPLQSNPFMYDMDELGCGESPLESMWTRGGTDKTSSMSGRDEMGYYDQKIPGLIKLAGIYVLTMDHLLEHY